MTSWRRQGQVPLAVSSRIVRVASSRIKLGTLGSCQKCITRPARLPLSAASSFSASKSARVIRDDSDTTSEWASCRSKNTRNDVLSVWPISDSGMQQRQSHRQSAVRSHLIIAISSAESLLYNAESADRQWSSKGRKRKSQGPTQTTTTGYRCWLMSVQIRNLPCRANDTDCTRSLLQAKSTFYHREDSTKKTW